jgi:putative phosphoesterase
MKYLVISDIHGDLTGAEILQKAVEQLQPDRILCLGDILYHGPRNDLPENYAPKKVIPIMNALKDRIIAVRGNCEAEVDQMVLAFPCMADYNVIPMGSMNVFMSHGHIYGPDHLPSLNENDIFLSGHTHIPTAVKKNGIYLLNPGSVSLPKEGHPRTYALLDETGFTIYTVDGTVYMQIKFERA